MKLIACLLLITAGFFLGAMKQDFIRVANAIVADPTPAPVVTKQPANPWTFEQHELNRGAYNHQRKSRF